jgi:hypothetical protein
MKKNIAYALLSIPLFLLAFWVWFMSALPNHVIEYTASDIDTQSILKKLELHEMSDIPNSFGAIGISYARDAAREARNAERQSWNDMNFPGMRLLGGNRLMQCADQVHDLRWNFLNSIDDLPASGVIKISEARALISAATSLADSTQQCHASGLKASGWKENLYARLTGKPTENDIRGQNEQELDRYIFGDKAKAESALAPAASTATPQPPPAQTAPDSVEACEVELKKFVIAQVGVFNEQNEAAMKRNCTTNREKWMCFLNKGKNSNGIAGYGGVSLALKGNLEHDCGLEISSPPPPPLPDGA